MEYPLKIYLPKITAVLLHEINLKFELQTTKLAGYSIVKLLSKFANPLPFQVVAYHF